MSNTKQQSRVTRVVIREDKGLTPASSGTPMPKVVPAQPAPQPPQKNKS